MMGEDKGVMGPALRQLLSLELFLNVSCSKVSLQLRLKG